MSRTATIIGSPVSPYVRKVLAVCTLKDVEVEIDPIPAFYGNDEFTRLSPLRRVPVLKDDLVTLADSSVICQYLEDRWPRPRLYPEDIARRAHARWLEEYADTRMADVVVWRLFFPAVVAPAVFGRPRDKEALARVTETELVEVLDFLEAEAGRNDAFCGAQSIAAISVASMLSNLYWARREIGPRWPGLQAWYDQVRAQEPFVSLERAGGVLAKTLPHEARRVATELGLKLTEQTLFTPTPRKGPMTV